MARNFKSISQRKAFRTRNYLEGRAEKIIEESKKLGGRFAKGAPGKTEEVVARARKEGLKAADYEEGHIPFTDAEGALNDASLNRENWTVMHSVPPRYLRKAEKRGAPDNKKGEAKGEKARIPFIKDFYAGHAKTEVTVDIPHKKVTTFLARSGKQSLSRIDPIMAEEEAKLNKGRRTLGDLTSQQHEVNMHSMILTDRAVKKHSGEITQAAKMALLKTGHVNFSQLRPVARKLGIPNEIVDEVIGNVMLNMNLKPLSKEGIFGKAPLSKTQIKKEKRRLEFE